MPPIDKYMTYPLTCCLQHWGRSRIHAEGICWAHGPQHCLLGCSGPGIY